MTSDVIYSALSCYLTHRKETQMIDQRTYRTQPCCLHFITVILLGAFAFMSNNSAKANSAKSPTTMPSEAEGFTFLNGNWRVFNRKVKEPMSGREEWIEFETKAKFFTLLDGLVSVEELRDAKGAHLIASAAPGRMHGYPRATVCCNCRHTVVSKTASAFGNRRKNSTVKKFARAEFGNAFRKTK
jgi:hypothetical protein